MIAPAFPAFNIYSRIARQTTALGPLAVATAMSRVPGWNVEVIDENNYRRPGPRDAHGLPDHPTLQAIRHADVVGLYGGLSSTIPRLLDLARIYRQPGVTIIAGGQHFVGENIRAALDNGIDFVVTGEGEHTIRELLETLRNGGNPATVSGVAFLQNRELVHTPHRPPITDFETLPLPDFSLLRYARVSLFPISWYRGCGMNCEFCTVKGKPRGARPERVMEQVALLFETYGARHFFIVDDLFGNNRAASLQLCGLLTDYQKAVGIHLDLTVQIRLDRARDAELLRAMRLAGVNMVCIGYESPIPEELKAMDKRTDPDDMLALTRLYHQAGFLVHGMFIFGYPLPLGVTMQMPAAERVRHFRRFIRNSRLDTIQVLLPVPLPGTELTQRLAANNRLYPGSCIGWEYYDGNFPLFRPDDPLTPEELQRAIRQIMGRFYRFSAMFSVAGNVLLFPAMLFSLRNIRFGWGKWHRGWRNNLVRFGGWILLRRWLSLYRHGSFAGKLAQAKQSLPSP